MPDTPLVRDPSKLWRQSQHPTGPVYRTLQYLMESGVPRLHAIRSEKKSKISFRFEVTGSTDSPTRRVRIRSILVLSKMDKWVEEDPELTKKEPDDTTVYRITSEGREAVVQVRAHQASRDSPQKKVREILEEERKRAGIT